MALEHTGSILAYLLEIKIHTVSSFRLEDSDQLHRITHASRIGLEYESLAMQMTQKERWA